MGFNSMNADGRGSEPVGGSTSSLILRAWLEPGDLPRLRVRVVVIGHGRNEQSMLVTASADEVCRAVCDWLHTLQR